MIDRFFRPFLGGIYFDSSLQVSSRLFYFVMRMLALGQNCLPARGIGAVSAQLASSLPAGSVHLDTRVATVTPASGPAPAKVTLESGATIAAAHGVVIAVEGPEAARLAGSQRLPGSDLKPRGSCCVYFDCVAPPKGPGGSEPILFLNGERTGLVNNICFPSLVAPTYAPAGRTLASAEVLGVPDMPDDELAEVWRRLCCHATPSSDSVSLLAYLLCVSCAGTRQQRDAVLACRCMLAGMYAQVPRVC